MLRAAGLKRRESNVLADLAWRHQRGAHRSKDYLCRQDVSSPGRTVFLVKPRIHPAASSSACGAEGYACAGIRTAIREDRTLFT